MVLYRFDLQSLHLVDHLVHSCLELYWHKNSVTLPMWFVDVDLHEFDVLTFPLQGSSGFQHVLVELSLNSADVASAILLVFSESIFEYLINFALDEIELRNHNWHHLRVESFELWVEAVDLDSNLFCENVQTFHSLVSGVVSAVDCVVHYIFEVALSGRL